MKDNYENIIGSIILIIALFSFIPFGLLNETEVMDTVCGDINLTGTNCTTWWTNLNLTEFNQTNLNITYLNITVVQGGNYTTTYSNFSTIENKTYNYYNYTGNISDLNLTNTYTKSQIDNKDNVLRSDTDNKLTSYALKTDNSTSTITKDIEAGWKWAFGINIFITVAILVAIAILFKQ